MIRMRVSGIFLIFSLILFSCSTTQEIKRPPNFRFVDLTLARGVNDKTVTAFPENPSITFSTKDEEVVAFLKLQNLWGKHTLKWDWYAPDSNLYSSTGNYSIQSADGKFFKEIAAWHRLSIRGEKAEDLTGIWVVNIFLDNELIASRKFKLE